jgi:hypothetical protein
MRLQEDYQLPSVATSASLGLDAARAQIDRVLASDTLRASEVLRRLLRFLADKTFSGEAEQLKEYSIGLDALGKPPDYDPRQDAAVRLQASRLRQKLDDYYRFEGKEDTVVIELPKGRFKIVWRLKSPDFAPAVVSTPPVVIPAPPVAEPVLRAAPPASNKWRSIAVGLALAASALAALSCWALLRVPKVGPAAAKPATELNLLWGSFISSPHRLLIAYSDPLFVRFQREGSPDVLFRKREVVTWDEAVKSSEFSILSRALGKPVPKPSYDYAVRSELISTFVLSQFFASRRSDISLTSIGELSWQQFADNDVFLLAPRFKINERQTELPVKPAFIVSEAGIRNLQPRPGEPAVYPDAPLHGESAGETIELVSVLPGPLGRTRIASVTGNRAWGVIGAVQSLTDPVFARVVVQKLSEHPGEIPPYYQLVMKVRYRDGTPTSASYVTHRALAMTQNSVDSHSAEH